MESLFKYPVHSDSNKTIHYKGETHACIRAGEYTGQDFDLLLNNIPFERPTYDFKTFVCNGICADYIGMNISRSYVLNFLARYSPWYMKRTGVYATTCPPRSRARVPKGKGKGKGLHKGAGKGKTKTSLFNKNKNWRTWGYHNNQKVTLCMKFNAGECKRTDIHYHHGCAHRLQHGRPCMQNQGPQRIHLTWNNTLDEFNNGFETYIFNTYYNNSGNLQSTDYSQISSCITSTLRPTLKG